jgi:LuxR family maltose regulon positive regulatory protein
MEQRHNDYNLLATKLTIPPSYLKETIPRQRLYTRLERAAHCPLILLAAPAGSGKTTLIREWLLQRTADDTSPMQSAWVTLEENDNDRVRFWRYIVTALSRFHPPLEQYRQAWLSATASSSEEMLIALINVLLSLPGEIILVLDDYHTIRTPSIHESLLFLLEHMPPQLHLIIGTRIDPPFPLARLRVHGLLTEFRASDLRFTQEECALFLTQAVDVPLTARDIDELTIRTEGWAAGLQLAAFSLLNRDDPGSITGFINTFNGTNRYVCNFLSEEVLSRLPEDIQNFLLTTSILERLNVSLCNKVTEQENAEAMLDWLEQADLFLLPLNDQERCYRYHYLFAGLLRHHLQQKQPQHVPELHRRASLWYEQHDLLMDAIHHALAAGDFTRAVTLIERCALLVLERDEYETIDAWLRALPAEIITTQPMLSYLSAHLSLSTARFHEHEQSILLAEQKWQAEQNTLMLSRVNILYACAALLRRDGPQAIDFSQQALALAPANDNTLSANARITLGAGYFFTGATALAWATLNEGDQLYRQHASNYALFLSTFYRGEILLAQGNLQEAAHTFQQVISHTTATWHCYHILAFIRLADIYREWNDPTSATRHWQEAMHLVEESEHRGLAISESLLLAARLAWLFGEYEQVIVWLDKTDSSVQCNDSHPPLLIQSAVQRVRVLLARNDLSSALQVAERSSPARDSSPLAKEAWDMLWARLHLAQGQAKEAIILLKEPLSQALEQGRSGHALPLLVLLALAYHQQGQTMQAMETLGRALLLGKQGNYIRVFLDEGPIVAKLLTKWCQHYRQKPQRESSSVSSSYVRAVLTASGTEDQLPTWITAHPREDSLVEKLSERENKVLSLTAEGLSNHEIAQRLVVTVSTIKTHLNNIYTKLNVHTRLQAVTRAYELGLLRRVEIDSEYLTYPPPSQRAR